MIAMVNTLNDNFFGGDQRVTCWTCHRGGEGIPATEPDLDVQYGPPRDPSPNTMDVARSSTSPQPVLDRYIQALGGAQRVAALTSYVATGTYTGYETGLGPVAMTLYAKAPNQRAMVLKMPEEDGVRVYDGTNGWIVGPERPIPIVTLTGANLFGARLESVLAFPANLRGEFTRWLSGSASIDGTEVAVAQGNRDGQLPVNFYFDRSTGLLKRVVRWNATAVGAVPTQIDFEDYRAVSGVQIPFKTVITWTNGRSELVFNQVQPNVNIEASRFARPAPARPRQ
jgi:outer membrane lipoprotein-sorting protein